MPDALPADVACAVCGQRRQADEGSVLVRSNVRAFRDEQFRLWQCRACKSIHAAENVQLEHYYSAYPFHRLPADWRLQALYANQVKRLIRAGVEPKQSILDYGCGDGRLVQYLRSAGYDQAYGFDSYGQGYTDDAVLSRQYDCVVSQDCLEHVEAPLALLDTFHELTRSGGLIVIGTPDASAIDLSRADEYLHTLHAPYHRHILSRQALIEAGEQRGWRLETFYPTMYSNTRIPFLNECFYRYYLTLTDDTLDALIEPVRSAPLLARLPLTLFYGLFGSFWSRRTDVAVIFRKP